MQSVTSTTWFRALPFLWRLTPGITNPLSIIALMGLESGAPPSSFVLAACASDAFICWLVHGVQVNTRPGWASTDLVTERITVYKNWGISVFLLLSRWLHESDHRHSVRQHVLVSWYFSFRLGRATS